jgi:hypothetical protein
MQGLNIISNYVPNIQHLPGIIDGDVFDTIRKTVDTIRKNEGQYKQW